MLFRVPHDTSEFTSRMSTTTTKTKYQPCKPTAGDYPGEDHEAVTSYLDQRKNVVMVVVRHLLTGICSHVPSSEVNYEVRR